MLDLRTLVPWAGRHGSTSTTPAPTARDTDPFTAFRRDMDRLFEDAFGRGLMPTFGEGARMFTPRMDVTETDGAIVVTMELPGVDEKDVTIDLSGDLLTVKGEKKEESETKEEGRHVVERSYGSFARTLRLPYAIDADTCDATVEKGVLTLRLPKPEEARVAPKRIEIRKGETAAGTPETKDEATAA